MNEKPARRTEGRSQKTEGKKKKIEVEEDRSRNGKRKEENVFLLTPVF